MKRTVSVLLLSVGFAISAETVLSKKSLSQVIKKDQPAQFEIEKDLLNKIYLESKSESVITSRPIQVGITFSPQVSLSNADEIILSNRYFDVSYSDNLKSVPGISFSVNSLLAYWGNLQVSVIGKATYSFKELTVEAYSKGSTGFNRDLIRLHWLPLSLGTKAEYEIPGFSYIKPYLNMGAGIQWLYQTGKLDGIEQGFWVPFYQIGGGLTFFGNQKSSQWFGGVTAGINLNQSFGSSQMVKSSSFEVGVNFIL